jgi:hypothetical protein
VSNAVPSRLGQVNTADDARALFYKLFTGEVLTAFDKKNIMMGRHRVRNIEHGKSAGFANTGRARGRVHQPGTEILGQRIAHNETVITIDDLLIADAFIANIDEAMNHYEVRGEYSKQLGEALARVFDKRVFRVALTAARSANKITGLPGGTSIGLSAGYAAASQLAKAQELAQSLFVAHQNFIEKDVPMDGVFAVFQPAEYFALVQNKELLNRDWGGLGSYAQADLPMVAGIPLVVSNHLPRQNDAVNGDGEYVDAGDIVEAKYAGNYAKVRGLIMTPDAAGTVKLMDLGIESQWDIRRQGTLMVAKMLSGSGVLRPECAQEIVLP